MCTIIITIIYVGSCCQVVAQAESQVHSFQEKSTMQLWPKIHDIHASGFGKWPFRKGEMLATGCSQNLLQSRTFVDWCNKISPNGAFAAVWHAKANAAPSSLESHRGSVDKKMGMPRYAKHIQAVSHCCVEWVEYGRMFLRILEGFVKVCQNSWSITVSCNKNQQNKLVGSGGFEKQD